MSDSRSIQTAPDAISLPRLPGHWQWATLGQLLVRIEAGKSFRCEERPPINSEHGVVKVSAVTWGAYDEEESKTITDEGRIDETYLIQPGDFLFSRANTLQLVGASVIVNSTSKRLLLSDKILRFVFAADIKQWVNWLFKSAFGRSQIEALSTGNQESMRNIGQQRIGQICVPVAPPVEMKRIVSKIDEFFSRIDEGERALEGVWKLLERYRQSLLKAAVTGELTREWRERNKHSLDSGEALLATILKARRKGWENAELAKMKAKGVKPANNTWKQKYSEPAPPNTTSLPTLPDRWIWASLDQVTSKITSGSRDWKEFYGRGESVFVMAQNVRPRCLDLTEVQLVDPPVGNRDAERSEVRQHDLLITIVGANTGDACRVREPLERHYVCQSVALARPVLAELSAFLELYLCADEGGQAEFAKVIYGAGRPHLSFDQIRALPVPLPPIGEQESAVDAIALAESEIESVVYGIKTSKESASALRHAVLKSAFAGSLVPQDAGDEPAAALLERIAAVRNGLAKQIPERRRNKLDA